jgi:hypothetical protein
MTTPTGRSLIQQINALPVPSGSLALWALGQSGFTIPVPALTVCQPLSPLNCTPSTIRRLAMRNTTSKGTALSTAPAMIGP